MKDNTSQYIIVYFPLSFLIWQCKKHYLSLVCTLVSWFYLAPLWRHSFVVLAVQFTLFRWFSMCQFPHCMLVTLGFFFPGILANFWWDCISMTPWVSAWHRLLFGLPQCIYISTLDQRDNVKMVYTNFFLSFFPF